MTEPEETLTAEQAAKEAGIAVVYFKKLMRELNNTPHDLRAPRQPGQRTRKYQAQKTRQWIKNGRPTGKNLPHPTNTTTITTTTTHGPNGWTTTHQNQTAIGRNLTELRRNLTALAAHQMGVAPEIVAVDLQIAIPEAAAPQFARLDAIAAEMEKLKAERDDQRQVAVFKMHELGLSNDDIAAVFGFTPPRIAQIIKEAQNKEAARTDIG
jgi:hypothetical protein